MEMIFSISRTAFALTSQIPQQNFGIKKKKKILKVIWTEREVGTKEVHLKML